MTTEKTFDATSNSNSAKVPLTAEEVAEWLPLYINNYVKPKVADTIRDMRDEYCLAFKDALTLFAYSFKDIDNKLTEIGWIHALDPEDGGICIYKKIPFVYDTNYFYTGAKLLDKEGDEVTEGEVFDAVMKFNSLSKPLQETFKEFLKEHGNLLSNMRNQDCCMMLQPVKGGEIEIRVAYLNAGEVS